MFIRRRNSASMRKHSGALMSSRLMAPKVGSRAATTSQKRAGSGASTSMSKTSTPANFLNSTAFPSITGLPARGPDIAEAEDSGTVGDDGDEVAACRVVERGVGVGLDGLAGGSDAGGICEREVMLGGHAFGGLDLQLSRAREPVVVERCLPEDIVHGSSILLTLFACPPRPQMTVEKRIRCLAHAAREPMGTGPNHHCELTFRKCRPRVIEHYLSPLRPLVALSGLYQQGTRRGQAEHVFQIAKRQDAGQTECHLDAGISCEGIPIVH